MTVTAVTAEWICSRCGATNRKLVPQYTKTASDSCVTCHASHILEPNRRPVRWSARLDD